MNDQCPLSDEQIDGIARRVYGFISLHPEKRREFGRAVATAAVEAERKGRTVSIRRVQAFSCFETGKTFKHTGEPRPTCQKWCGYDSHCPASFEDVPAGNLPALRAIPEDRAALVEEAQLLIRPLFRAVRSINDDDDTEGIGAALAAEAALVAAIDALAVSPPPSAVPEDAMRVVEAAKWANFCPTAGGYKGGRSVEDCYEALSAAVNAYYGVNAHVPMDDWISEDELEALIAAAQQGEKP